ncbi:MAG: pyridoxamine 5'-phosphate oxidase family protein [Acidimicrobiales bacterium]|jgi:nitroimidazol reductase NimA-like FMN-containing flavoprotein (pyridoxamine 5'-phosphate oxidase superfamily)
MAPAPLSVLTGSLAGSGQRSSPAERLLPARCMQLLASASSGHLALSQGALPLVVPVTCSLDGGRLLVRAALGLLGASLGQPGVVAFHTGATSPDQSERWEVLVQGRAELHGREAPRQARRPNPPGLPLVAEDATVVLSVSIELVTGWQYAGAQRTRSTISPITKAKKETAR